MAKTLTYAATDAEAPFDKNAWGTPQSLFDQLNQEFSFTLDAAADSTNHKCANYFTKEQDSLSQKWEGRVFVNPPYQTSILKSFVAKAATSVHNGDAELVVMVIPSATDTNWWHEWIFPSATEIRFTKGRVKFVKTGSGLAEGKGRSNFGTAIVVFGGKKEIGEGLKVVPADLTGKVWTENSSGGTSVSGSNRFRDVAA